MAKNFFARVLPFVAISATARPVAFDGTEWKFKMVNGAIEMKDGKPIAIKPDGSEVPYDLNQTTATIQRITGDLTTAKTKLAAAEAKAAAFDGLDPAVAKEAIDTVSKIKDKKLLDTAGVDQLRAEITKGYETKIAEKEAAITAANSKLNGMMLGAAFTGSKYVADKLAIPVDLAQSFFGQFFSVEGDKITAKGRDGNPIYAPDRPGEIANFDEALSVLVGGYPHKDQILKGSKHTGGGAVGPDGKPITGGVRTILRADFEKLSPAEKMTTANEMSSGKAKIVDAA